MIANIFAGIVTGFLISIPPFGPIAFAMISKGFKNEIKEGRAIAIGAAFMDFFYSLIAFSGLTLIISFFPSGVGKFYARHSQSIVLALAFVGCVILFFYGLKIMRTKIAYTKLAAELSPKLESALAKAIRLEGKAENAVKHLGIKDIKALKEPNSVGLFFTGVLLAASSLTLPASWFALVGYLKGHGFLASSFLGGLGFSVGVFAGTLTWYSLLLALITGHKHRITQKTINKLNVAAGSVLICIGAGLFINAVVAVLRFL